MKKVIGGLFIAILVVLLLVQVASSVAKEDTTNSIYVCPMHPNVKSDQPGTCPICGMDLVPLNPESEKKEEEHSSLEHNSDSSSGTVYTCPMHPNIRSDKPGTCPICGMDLVPLEDTADKAASGDHIKIDPSVVQLMNVVTTTVERKDLVIPVIAVGFLTYDQKRMVSVTPRYSGWIERSYISSVGEKVKKGEVLFEIYSPEVVAAQEDLILALKYLHKLNTSSEAQRDIARSMVRSARDKLRFLGIDEIDISFVEKNLKTKESMPLRAPASGVVMKLSPGNVGMAVKPGYDLMHIADISTLLVRIDLFEEQIMFVEIGSRATVEVSYFPGEQFDSKVVYISPDIDPKTRTLPVFLEVNNSSEKLKVGMFVSVKFEDFIEKNSLVVPKTAVLRTGKRDVVVVEVDKGTFAVREVELGKENDNYYQVISGVEDGEKVVINSQFLIDTEANLRKAFMGSAHQSH